MAVARTRQGTNAAASAAQARRPQAQQGNQPQPARSAALRSTAPPAVTLGPPAVGPAARRQAVMTRLRNAAARQQGAASSPASQQQASREAAAEASRAAPSPANEARAQAQAGQAEVMSEQRAGSVQQNTFLELVERQLNAVPMPRNPEEMDRFRQNNSAGGLRQQLQGSVGEQSAQAQNNIRSATEAQPAAGPNRQPSALPAQGGPPARGNLRTQEILPERRTEQEVSLEASRQQVEGQMRENNLTEDRLREANDPRFTAVQEARESVHEQAARAPAEYRVAEQAELQRQEGAVARDEQAATREMSADRERANSQIATQQRQAMTREEAERRQVSERIERMFTEAQTRVQNKLTWLDGEVDRRFTEGEARAKQMFEAFVEDAMYQWKLRRYGRWLFVPGVGAAYALGRWVADKLIDLNQFPEIQAIYDNGKRLYVRKMREMIVEIAGVVETSLRWCADEIARSRQQIQDYVQSLPQALRRVGEETSRGVSERFDQLRNTVNERREALANRLVERYRQAQQALDQRIQQMQAANRGLINRFVAAIREVIEIINNFRRQLMSLIGEARSVIDRIVERPVNFLQNLVRALRMGFDQFSRNIWNHLRSALLNWLFGTLAEAGIQMPESFDLRSIIGLILQILGISYAQIRGKVARIIGERNMAILEHAWRYISALIREGPIGLWNEIRNDLSSLWEMALQTVREWVITNLVRAAITRLVSMFNPVGAIIQAVLAIYNTVMFFVEKIQQIMELVRTVVRSLDKIVRGDLAEAANWVENAMARTLPIIIAFLARLLGLSGISDRIREFIQRIQARVDRAIDAALERIVGGIRRLFGGGAAAATTAAAEQIPDERIPFDADGESHTVWTETRNGQVRIMVASLNPQEIETLLDHFTTRISDLPEAQRGRATDTIRRVRARLEEWRTAKTRPNPNKSRDQNIAFEHTKAGEVVSVLDQVFTLFHEHGMPAEMSARQVPGNMRYSITTRSNVRLTVGGDPPLIMRQYTMPSAAQTVQTPLPAPLTAPHDVRPELGQRTWQPDPNAPARNYWVIDANNPNRLRYSERPGGVVFAPTPEPPPPSTTAAPPAAAAAPPQPAPVAETRSRIEVQTWNTADSRQGHHGASHAEAQFTRWFRNQPDDYNLKVRKIEIYNNPLSPCKTCAEDLAGLLRDVKSQQANENLARRRAHPPMILKPQIPPFEVAILYFNEHYTHPEVGTMQEDIDGMERVGWRVRGRINREFRIVTRGGRTRG